MRKMLTTYLKRPRRLHGISMMRVWISRSHLCPVCNREVHLNSKSQTTCSLGGQNWFVWHAAAKLWSPTNEHPKPPRLTPEQLRRAERTSGRKSKSTQCAARSLPSSYYQIIITDAFTCRENIKAACCGAHWLGLLAAGRLHLLSHCIFIRLLKDFLKS